MCSKYGYACLEKLPYIFSFLLFVGFIAASAGYIATTKHPYYDGALFMVVVGIFGSIIVCSCKDTTVPGYTNDPLRKNLFEPRPQYIYGMNTVSEQP